jgi:predicted Fe-Mo cluster-binding NifX family protein
MRLCIPAERPALDAPVDARLGRAAVFVLVDNDTGEMVGAVENVQNKQAASGAGVQAGQAIANSGAQAVLCTHVGPKAFRVLQAAGLQVYTGAEGTVADAVKAFQEERLEKTGSANVAGHW